MFQVLGSARLACTVESGSSGSPLFDNNKLVVGILRGNSANDCATTANGWFAQLSNSWDPPNSDFERELKHWLDPNNTNPSTVSGGVYQECSPKHIDKDAITASVTEQAGIDITADGVINNGITAVFKAGRAIYLEPGFQSGTNFIAEINPCVIDRTTIAAKTDDIVQESAAIETNNKFNSIKIYPTIVPSGNAINIEVADVTEKLQIAIYDLQGKIILQTTLYNLNAKEPNSILLSGIISGFYLVRAEGGSISFTQKIIVQ